MDFLRRRNTTPPKNTLYDLDSGVRSDAAVTAALQAGIRSRLESGTLVVPRLPQAAARLMQITQSGDVDFGEVADVILTDPALAARVLSTANSAAFGGMPVESLNAAIIRLGIKTLSNIVFTESLQTRLFTARSHRELVEQSWRASLGAAVGCEVLARATGVAGEMAFMIGLMHDTGTPVLAAEVAEYEKANPARKFEQGIVELLHAELHEEIGAHVLQRWGMPQPVVEAAACHHRYKGGHAATPAHHIICAAVLACRHLGIGSPPREVVFNLERAFTDLDLTRNEQIQPLLKEITDDFERLAAGLGGGGQAHHGHSEPPHGSRRAA